MSSERNIEICTIGHERAAFADFAATLVAAGVTLLIDVRATAFAPARVRVQASGAGTGGVRHPL